MGDAETGSCSVRDAEETWEEAQRRTLVCLEMYSSSAVAYMLEAEKLTLEALERRDAAMALFARATELATEFANRKRDPGPADTYEDIAF